jgi:hypothetical protein
MTTFYLLHNVSMRLLFRPRLRKHLPDVSVAERKRKRQRERERER